MRLKLAPAVLLLALAGCGTIGDRGPQDVPASVEDARGAGVDAALAHYARLRKLPAAELAREQESARRAFNRSRTDANRVRYALSLAVPGAPSGDEVRALDALEPVARNGASTWNGLAVLVSAFLQEQRRRDGQAQDLQQKLDALLNLERNMTGRESGGARKR
ncbi:MAG: hypothetical protein ACO3F9_10755 [Burkholderiales bacterium]